MPFLCLLRFLADLLHDLESLLGDVKVFEILTHARLHRMLVADGGVDLAKLAPQAFLLVRQFDLLVTRRGKLLLQRLVGRRCGLKVLPGGMQVLQDELVVC